MQMVSLIFQILQDFAGMREKQGAFRQRVQVGMAEMPGQPGIIQLKFQEGAVHPFPPQFFLADQAFAVLAPVKMIVNGITGMKLGEGHGGELIQPVLFKYLFQGGLRISVKIPERMVQVKEEVPVWFGMVQLNFHSGYAGEIALYQFIDFDFNLGGKRQIEVHA